MLRIIKTIINKHRYDVMLKLYMKNKRTRKMFFRLIDKYEGGIYNSKTLRMVFSEQYKISAGQYSYGCFDPQLNYGEPIEIGNYCSIADSVHFIPFNHPATNVSTHPFFYEPSLGCVEQSAGMHNLQPTVVGHDVWIGRNSVILPKCKVIGNGAIIGAGSVVTHDVEPYSIMAGNPACEIRKRFSKEQIEKLEQSEWWVLTAKQLSNAFQFYQDIDRFSEEVLRIKKELFL